MRSPHRTENARISVAIQTNDPISRTGIVGQLRACPEVTLHSSDDADSPNVTLVVADVIDDDTLQILRHLQRTRTTRLLLVVTMIDEQALLRALECGVLGVVWRGDATPDGLIKAIRPVANGHGYLPPDLLGTLLGEVRRVQTSVMAPRGLHFTTLSDGEIDVLQLLAAGYETEEIATKLGYSIRTIKNRIHGVTTRLQLKNRSHAVAWALRRG
ncbi:LuxR C-terminal-related transcriptional regulator [Streptomyces sp. NPDC056358]|uniref:helix-turn-helix transcriptional regulator n=1 Tax=Streptomyces sp. NPDC056358 TaxID=3345794 RepID=UPI0035D93124